MGTAANQAKTRWNAKNYTQVKVYVEPGVASAFKAACSRNGDSMASVISQFMAEYSGTAAQARPRAGLDVSTRRKRRQIVSRMAKELEEVRDAEMGYLERIPENLHGSARYEAAEESVSAMDEALDLLGGVY